MLHATTRGVNRHGHNFEGTEISVGIIFGGQMLEFAVEARMALSHRRRIRSAERARRAAHQGPRRSRAALEEPFQGSNLGALALAAPWSGLSGNRVPEALHLAVRATRYGCTDDETGQWSSKAFQLLRRRYPKSEWAAKTKYHY